MPSERPPRMALLFTPEVKRNLRALAGTYRHLRSDVEPVIERLQSGETIGDQIRGARHTVFKARIRNSDIRRGKLSGYRLIYHLQSPTSIVLVTVYSELDQADISAERIRRILRQSDRRSA